MTSVLVLGGSFEASALVRRLHASGVSVTTSFAGRVERLPDLPGEVRVGGFGGVPGLVAYLREEGHDLVVDATHPFAASMGAHAAAAAQQVGRPRLRLLRPPWTPEVGDDWHDVADLDDAAAWVDRRRPATVLLATGRQDTAPFERVADVRFVLRSIDPPAVMPDGWEVVLDRGPFDLAAERALLESHGVEAIVTRNSGGEATRPKLDAARELGVPVVLLRRPTPVPGPTVTTVDEAEAWVLRPGGARRSGRRSRS